MIVFGGIKPDVSVVGNLMVLLAQKCAPLCQTKLLKLLYLVDEESMRRHGVPITWLSHRVWKFGPVAQDVFYSKYPGNNRYSDYVKFERHGARHIVVPMVMFSDEAFSELDMEVITDVLKQHGHKTAKELIDLTHRPDSLWSKTKDRHHISFSQENFTGGDVEIDFSELLDDGMKKTMFYTTLENKQVDCVLS